MEDGSNIEIIKPYQHLFTAMFLPREIQIWSFLNFRILTNCMQLQYNLITHTYKCLWIVCMHMYNQLQWLFLFWIFVRLPGEETFESENRGHVEDQKEYTRFLICEEIGSRSVIRIHCGKGSQEGRIVRPQKSPGSSPAETERCVTLSRITHVLFVGYQGLGCLTWSTDATEAIISVFRLGGPPLWCRLKCLHNYQMICHEVWFRRSSPLQDIL